jgi:hypothetical protein
VAKKSRKCSVIRRKRTVRRTSRKRSVRRTSKKSVRRTKRKSSRKRSYKYRGRGDRHQFSDYKSIQSHKQSPDDDKIFNTIKDKDRIGFTYNSKHIYGMVMTKLPKKIVLDILNKYDISNGEYEIFDKQGMSDIRIR